ncbi:MAG: YciI family protein [Caldimonas sp.]
MNYTILIYENAAGLALRTDPAKAAAYWAAWPAYGKALKDAGVMVGGAGLELPQSATTLRMQGGKRQVQDGPYADTKEQLGGFYIIDVPTLDAALDWGARVPAAPDSVIEVRPNLRVPG